MRITEMHITPIALGDPPLLTAAGLHAPYCLRTIVELITDSGLSGLAEVCGSVAVDQALAAVRDTVVGSDPLNWHGLREKIAGRCGPEACVGRGDKPWDGRTTTQVYSALDVACLDLQGKAFNVPVAALLGGVVRTRVPYAAYIFYKYEGAGGDLGFEVDPKAGGWDAARQRAALDPEGILEQARAMVAEFGFKSIKLKGGCFEPEEEVVAVMALWKAFPGMPLRLDPTALWSVKTSIKWGRAMEGFLEYLEDPCRSQAGMAEVRKAEKIPLATSMCTTSVADLPASVSLGSEDIILADHHFWGGLRASMGLASHCRTFNQGVSMQSSNQAGISMAAMTHLGAAMPNLTYALDTHYPWQSDEITVGGRFEIEDGCVTLPEGAGLGVEVDRAALSRAHEAYKRCGLTERNDGKEMRKKVPTWTFQQTRW
jgi:glucarate dehydratase